MKKTKSILFAVTVFFIISSCKQKQGNWACSCDVKHLSTGNKETVKDTIINQTKSNANANCGEFGKKSVGGNGSWVCVIKELP